LFDDQTLLTVPSSTARAANRTGPREGLLPNLLGYNLRLAQVRVFQDFAGAMAEFGLTPGQLGAMLLIEARSGLSQSALASALGIDRSSAVPLIDGLQNRGLVRRSAHADDRRKHALALTAAGTALLERLKPQLDAHERRIARRLSTAERARLIESLGRVARD
jgi:DNA-binding MarR family transcriptional regulator